MLLDLSRFRGTVDRVERREDPAVVASPGDEFRIVSPVDFAVDVRKDKEKVRLVGRMQTRLELDCGRCLEPYQVPVDAHIDLMFLPGAANTGLPEAEIEDEDVGVSFYHDDTIDLTEVMREQCHLALPMKPLCREDCQGLCPVCGTNLNKGTCNCTRDWEDPRLAALKKLKAES